MFERFQANQFYLLKKLDKQPHFLLENRILNCSRICRLQKCILLHFYSIRYTTYFALKTTLYESTVKNSFYSIVAYLFLVEKLIWWVFSTVWKGPDYLVLTGLKWFIIIKCLIWQWAFVTSIMNEPFRWPWAKNFRVNLKDIIFLHDETQNSFEKKTQGFVFGKISWVIT